MLTLSTTDISLQKTASTKQDAIRALASDLTNKSFVDSGYVEGMLNREDQNSTYLGNGIAIPHGTVDTRHLVKNTGVTVHHFPQGIDWGNDNTVYIAIGIAAKSDEHLDILRQLTKVLSVDGVEESLKNATSKEAILSLLNGEAQLTADFDASLIQQNFPASDMIQMSAVAGGLIKISGSANSEFVAELVTKEPTHLGHGLWLVSSNKGVSRTSMSFVSTANDCEYNELPVRALIALSVCNAAHKPLLQTLSQLVFEQKQSAIAEANSTELIAMFSQSDEVETHSESNSDNVAVFKIKNSHGLHARPGAMLVAEAKKFESTIKVSNLNSDSKPVNAKSLMKVIGLGVSCGHELQFSAQGVDAKQALDAIGAAINSGLGES